MASKEDATSCPICQDFYRDPRFLPCGHSFCLECIQGVAGNNKWTFCPLCRSKVILGNGKVDQLPKNYVLSDILEDKGKTNQSMCLQHNKLLDIFCEQCDMMICSKCLSMQHKGHAIEDIDKIFRERNEQLKAFLDETELSVSMIQEKRSVIEQSRNALQKNADSIHKTVSNMFKKWFDGLQAKENALLSSVRQEGDKKIQICAEADSDLLKSLSRVTELGEAISQTRSKNMEFVIQQYSSIRVRHEDTGRIIQLNVRTHFTPPEELKIEVCAPWIEEAITNIKYTDLMKEKASPQPQKISEISKENTNLNRDKKQLECENKFLKNFLSDLHKYSTSHMQGITFETSSTVEPDMAVTTQYQQVQDVYNTLREMERKTEELEFENKFLKLLLCELHSYCTSYTEASIFQKPSTVKPDKAVSTQFQQAHNVYHNFKEMKRKYDILVNETGALQMTVEEMASTLFDEKYESLPLNDAVQQISTKIGSLILDLENAITEKEELQNANNNLLMSNDSYRQNNEELQISLQAVKKCRSEEQRKVSILQKQAQSMTSDLQSANKEISELRWVQNIRYVPQQRHRKEPNENGKEPNENGKEPNENGKEPNENGRIKESDLPNFVLKAIIVLLFVIFLVWAAYRKKDI